MAGNVCFFAKVYHVRTDSEIDLGMLRTGVYIESIGLDGPKLVLTFRDEDYIKNTLEVRELDEFVVSFADTWSEEGTTFEQSFTALSVKSGELRTIKLSLIATELYSIKTIAQKSRIFTSRGVSEVVSSLTSGLTKDMGTFPIVMNYHCLMGERPAKLLQQIASEHGAHGWIARGKFHMWRFAELFSESSAMTFHHKTINSGYPIIEYTQPSKHLSLEENVMRTFTAWDEVEGRMQSSPSGGIASGAPVITGVASDFVLSNRMLAKKTVVEFVTLGNLAITAGMAIDLVWHHNDPENPINEGLPAKVVVESVAHQYTTQKYYCKIRGAIALESY